MEDGYVYFIYAPMANLIKIGYTSKPKQRIRSLQIGNGENLMLLYFHRASRDLEQILHLILKKYRRRGEWFVPSPYVLSTIEELKGAPVSLTASCPFPPDIFPSDAAWPANPVSLEELLGF
jgi:hypothetical protein